MSPNVINSALKFIENILHKLGKDIKTALKGEMKDVSTSLDKSTKQQSAIFSQAVSKLETAINKIKEPKFSGKITIDTTKLERELSSAVNGIKSAIKPVSLDDVKVALKMINQTVKESNESNSSALKDGMTAIAEALQALNLVVPDTFKIDKMQLREIAGGNASSIYGGPVPARSTIITRVTMTDANTEYSHIFNKHAVMWRIKLEAQNASFNYSWTTGKLKTSGDGTSYISIPANWLESRDNTEYGAKTIYFESGTASQTMEVEEGIA